MATDLLDELLAFTEAVLHEPEAPRPAAPPPVRPRPELRRAAVPSTATGWPRPRRTRLAVLPLVVYALVALPSVAPPLHVAVDGAHITIHARQVDALLSSTLGS